METPIIALIPKTGRVILSAGNTIIVEEPGEYRIESCIIGGRSSNPYHDIKTLDTPLEEPKHSTPFTIQVEEEVGGSKTKEEVERNVADEIRFFTDEKKETLLTRSIEQIIKKANDKWQEQV